MIATYRNRVDIFKHTYHSYIPDYINVLEVFKPKTVLEWGPGPNTYLAFSRGVKKLHSIEQNKKWLININVPEYTYKIIPVDSEDYVKFPNGSNDWDLCFVDSRRRQECMDLIYNAGKKNTIVCLHDSQRERYQKHIFQFEYIIFLAKGFCIMSHSSHILDIKKEYSNLELIDEN